MNYESTRSTTYANHHSEGMTMQFQRDKLHNAPPPPAAVRSAFPGKTSPRLLAIAVPFNSQKSGAWLFVHGCGLRIVSRSAELVFGGRCGGLPRRGGDVESRRDGTRGETSPTKRIKPCEAIKPGGGKAGEAGGGKSRVRPDYAFGCESYGDFESARDYWHSFDGGLD